jgi:hypothetical protein
VIPGSQDDTAPLEAEPDLAELDNETEITALRTEGGLEVSPNSPTYRWTTFEDILRKRWEDGLQSSIDNAQRADSETLSERERLERRKAS